MKKVLCSLLAVAMILSAVCLTAFAAEGDVAKIGETTYPTLFDAVKNVQAGDTIELLADAEGCGISVPSGSEFTIDFGGHTYAVTQEALAGSTGTKTQAFQLLRDSTLTFKNGTITGDHPNLRMLVQNYANLTLEDMTLDASNLPGVSYVMSNNYGDSKLTGNTNIYAAPGNIAFDVCYWNGNGASYDNVSLTVETEGTIDGRVEKTVYGTVVEGKSNDLTVNKGTFTATTVEGNTAADNKPLAEFVPEENKANVTIVAKKVYVQYKETTAADAVGEDVYEIVLAGADGADIHELASADLTFEFVGTPVEDGAMNYTIVPAEGVTLSQTGKTGEENRYMFNYNGADKHEETASEIVIGTLTVSGYGTYTLATGEAATNAVYATTIEDNLVDDYTAAAELVINEDMVAEDGMVGEITDGEIAIPTYELTINVTFPNAVEYNAADYQDMTVTIVGGTVNETINLGADEAEYTITRDLACNTTYTVTVEGAGYRTARYSVVLTGDKTLNFWNNDKTNPAEVEVGKPGSAVNNNYLAGEIVKDNIINVFDLSAVVSYFGSESTVENGYAKYDLNRDGVIDAKDVAYVLVSWGK